jgi:hypothetical protein
MDNMNSAMALSQFNQFELLARQDTAFLSISQSVRGYAMLWLRIVVFVFLIIPYLVIAQFIPVVFKSHLNKIYPALPYIEDRKSLEWLRDTFRLYHFSLKVYRPVALYKKNFDSLMEELDEHIESLEYVLNNEQSISQTLKDHHLVH